MAGGNNELIQCLTCNGSGTILGQWDRITGGRNLRCPVCIGTGKVERTYTNGSHSTKSDDTPTQNLEETESHQEYEVNEETVEEMRELGEARRVEKAKASQYTEQFIKRSRLRFILTTTCLISIIAIAFGILFYSSEYEFFTLDSRGGAHPKSNTITPTSYDSKLINEPLPNTTELIPSGVLELVEKYVFSECHMASPLRHVQMPFVASYETDGLWHVYNEDQLKGMANMPDDNPNRKTLTFFTVNDKTKVVDTTYEGEKSPTTTLCNPR